MKEKIFEQAGIPKDQQGIIWSGIQLGGSCTSSKTVLLSEYEGTSERLNCECANKDTLGFWNIPNGAMMDLVIKLRGC